MASALRTARDAADLFAPRFAGRMRELLLVAYLDAARAPICVSEEAGADVAYVPLPIRAIVETALRADARGLILAHNHPSGDPSPSDADRAASRTLSDALAPLGIVLHDHLIFANGRWSSLRALRLL